MDFEAFAIKLRNVFSAENTLILNDTVSDIMKNCVDLSMIQAEVAAILSDQARLAEAVQCSYFHDNGFIKLFLLRESDPDFRIRLHLWPGQSVNSGGYLESNVHNHTRELWSAVLSGEITNDIFEVTSDVGDWFQHSLGVKGMGNGFNVIKIGNAKLGIIAESNYAAGEFYSMESHVLHRIRVPPGVPTATLFVQGPVARSRTISYSRKAIPESDGFRKIACISESDLVGNLRDFLSFGSGGRVF